MQHARKEQHQEAHKIVATSPQSKAVTLTQQYVCQIHSQRHIKVRALEMGYLEAIPVKEGQEVKEGDLLFKVIPILYQKKADAEKAEAKLAQLEFNYTKKLCEDKVVSQNEVALLEAKLAKAQAKAKLAEAELDFATVKAPFDGIVDRLHHQQGSLVEEGEILTTLSDNSVMWVYFNVPEARYLEYMADLNQNKDDLQIELVLANGEQVRAARQDRCDRGRLQQRDRKHPLPRGFSEPGPPAASRSDRHRVDQPSAERRHRHPSTGDFRGSRTSGTFTSSTKITWRISARSSSRTNWRTSLSSRTGLGVDDKIVLEGIRQVRDGDKVEYEDRQPEAGRCKPKIPRGIATASRYGNTETNRILSEPCSQNSSIDRHWRSLSR